MVLSLLLVSCAPGVTEDKEVTPAVEEEGEVTPAAEEERAPAVEEKGAPTVEKTEFIEPDPSVSSGSPSVVYVYHKGFTLGGDVHVTVTNRGGPGIVEIIYEITPWPSYKADKQTKSRFVYLDAGEQRKVSTFIPLPTGAKEISVDVTAYSPDQAAVDSLIQDLYHGDLEVRKNATITLGNFHIKRAVEPLTGILEDDESNAVRSEAARSLGKIGDETAIEQLISALEDSEESVRKAAVEALGNIGDKRAVEPLIRILKDDDIPANNSTRTEAARALGKIGDERAIEPLEACLKDKSWFVRDAANSALQEIREK